MANNMRRLEKRKKIALIAHDNKKKGFNRVGGV
jgi:hypothetical protein